LRATLEELAAVGYAALSVEAIASRVGIAKTTVYRRYATKPVLVRAAIEKFIDTLAGESADTGSLRGDLIDFGLQVCRISTSIIGKSLLKIGLECPEPELVEMSKEFEAKKNARDAVVANRALARGEISNPTELVRLMEVLVGSIIFRLAFKQESVDEVEIGKTVDLLLGGVSKPPPPGPRRRSSASL